MIRVGLFIDTYFPMVDGVINVVNSYATRLNDDEFEVTVFCPKHGKGYVDNFNYKVVRCKSFKVFFLDYGVPVPRLDRKFKKILKGSKLDIVHIHSPFGVGKMGIRYAKKHNIPVIATMHSQFKKDFYRTTHSKLITSILLKTVMKTFNQCTEYYAVNDAVSDIFLEYGAKHKPLVLNNCTEFKPVPDRQAAIEKINSEYSIPADMPVFIFVGRITILKNVIFLADALACLKSKYFKMIFVGDGMDMPVLKERIEKHGLTQNTLFLGKISDRQLISELFARAQLFLFPSLYDASSLVQIEAASQSTPTVFQQGAATAATVTDGVNGFIAPNTPEEYAATVESVLADRQKYEEVRAACFNDLYRTWDDGVRELKEIYRRHVEQNKNK